MPYIEESGKQSLAGLIDLAKSFSTNLAKNKSSGANNGTLTKSSIMKASKDLVLSFPVLCSNTVTPQTATMITKAIERNCVTTLQMLFSASYLKGESGQEVLRKWHKNMDDNFTMDDYLDIVNSVMDTVGVKEQEISKTIGDSMLEQFLSEQTRYPLSSFSESSIQGFVITENYRGEYTVRRDYIKEVNDPYEQFKANIESNKLGLAMKNSTDQKNASDRKFASDQQKTAAENIRKDADARAGKQTAEDKKNQEELNYELNKKRLDATMMQDKSEFFAKQLLDSDVKKCNELVPSMIIVRFSAIDTEGKNNDFLIEQQFIAGVKARLIPCDSMEIIERIASINKTKPSLVNLIRATTGEIKLARDFVFAIDQAKIDAKVNSKLSRTSPIWRSLQARSTKSGINRLKRNKANDAGAITTLVLTSEEVNMLKKVYNYDIYNINKAQFVMESYNLMGLVVVDEEIEVARFLLDGEKYYQDYSFNSLERETGDGSYKKVINLISKINRG